MSAPRTKRQFAGAASDPPQRPITSFFTPSGASEDAAAARSKTGASSPQRSLAPTLPLSVQASLLNVGMRVRKSVPEGYKTGTYSKQAAAQYGDAWSSKASTSAPTAVPMPSRQRELAPFCGIHQVGGMGVQPSVLEADPTPSIDDVPGLSSSQESVASTASVATVGSTAGSRKRQRGGGHCADEDDAEHASSVDLPTKLDADHPRVWRHQIPDGDVSPRSLAPVGWGNPRVIAAPRSRRGGAGGPSDAAATTGALTPPPPLSDPGRGATDVVIAGDDFGEADFLDYGLAADLDMGGV